MRNTTKTILLTGFILVGLASAAPVHATVTDHSGFGEKLFTMQMPTGFADPTAPVLDAENMDKAAATAAQIDPAAGNTSTRVTTATRH